MLAVTVFSTASIAMLVGLVGGIASSIFDARVAIADALNFDGYALVTPQRCRPA